MRAFSVVVYTATIFAACSARSSGPAGSPTPKPSPDGKIVDRWIATIVERDRTETPEPPKEVAWSRASELVRSCSVIAVSQTHAGHTEILLKDGTSRKSDEPDLDDILYEAMRASDHCGFRISMVTE